MADAFDYYERANQMHENRRMNDARLKMQEAQLKEMALKDRFDRDTYADRVRAQAISNQFNQAQTTGLQNRNRLFGDTYQDQLIASGLANDQTRSSIAHQKAQAGHQQVLRNQAEEKRLVDQNRYLGIMARDAQNRYEGDSVAQAQAIRANAANMGFSPALVEKITPESVQQLATIPAALGYEADRSMTEYQRASLDARAADRALERERIDIALGNQDPVQRRDRKAADAYGTSIGKVRADKLESAPDVIKNANLMLSVIDEAINHPGREMGTGSTSMIPAATRALGFSSEGGDFLAVRDQLQGQTFLQAYAGLRGGGQITEVEGEKAQNAIARLQTNQTDEAFLQSLKDLKEVVEAEKSRAENLIDRTPGLTGEGVMAQPVRKQESGNTVKRIKIDAQGNIIQ